MDTPNNQDSIVASHGLFFAAILANHGMLSQAFNVDEQLRISFHEVVSIMPSDDLQEMLEEVMKIAEQAAQENGDSFVMTTRGIDEQAFYALVTPKGSPITMDAAIDAFLAQKLKTPAVAGQSSAAEPSAAESSDEKSAYHVPRVVKEDERVGFESHALFIVEIANEDMTLIPLNRNDEGFLFGRDAALYGAASQEIHHEIIQKTLQATVDRNHRPYMLQERRIEQGFYALICELGEREHFPLDAVVDAFEIYLDVLEHYDNRDTGLIQ